MSDAAWTDLVLERLKTKIVPHRNYAQARARLNSALLVRQGGECLGFTGPSRGGKTSITEEIERLHNPPDAQELLVRRPVVLIRVRNKGDKGNFTTKNFYLNALKAIQHPFFVLTGSDLVENANRIQRMHNEPNDTLADILENALEVLGVKYLIIDETQHFRYIAGGDKNACQILESLKTLAEAIGCVIVFVGAYPILHVLRLAPHILGREYLIDLPRYKADAPGDILAFEQTLQWFSKDIQFAKGVTSLRDWNELLFDGALGVPGLLSAWVRDAISEMLARGESELHLDHVLFSQKKRTDRSEILSEIEIGEEYLVGWNYGDDHGPDSGKKTKKTEPETKPKKPRSRPFQTKAKRRAVGGRT